LPGLPRVTYFTLEGGLGVAATYVAPFTFTYGVAGSYELNESA
jgi:hypothetical protein